VFSAAAGAAGGGRNLRFPQTLDDDRDQRRQQQWQHAIQGMVDHAGELRLHGPGLDLQSVDRGAMILAGEFEFAAGRRPSRDHEQDGCDHKIDHAKDGGGRDRAPDLNQGEISR
jgi:hypothetical protein